MRYEPSLNEHEAPRATGSGTSLPRTDRASGVGDSGRIGGRQIAELDIWEDEGGATSGRGSRYRGRAVALEGDGAGERHRGDLSGW